MRALAVLVAALVLAPAAAASTPLGDLAVHDLRLQVNANGKALLTYRREDGRIRNVLVWGAINARPPSTDGAAGRLPVRLLGRAREPRPLRRAAVREPLRAVRRAAPPVPRHRLQGARRDLLGGAGVAAAAADARASRRGCRSRESSSSTSRTGRGRSRELEVSQNWTYGGHWQGLFGRLTYAASPCTASTRRRRRSAATATRATSTSTRTTRPTAPAGATTQAKCCTSGNGAFCYSFVPQVPPPGYPGSRAPRGPAIGDAHRVTVMGPGVTPDVQWEGPPLGAVQRCARRDASTRCSTGSSARTTRSARTSADGRERSQPR